MTNLLLIHRVVTTWEEKKRDSELLQISLLFVTTWEEKKRDLEQL